MNIKRYYNLINVYVKHKRIGTVRIKTTYVLDDTFKFYDVNLDDYYEIKKQLDNIKGKVEWQIVWDEEEGNNYKGNYDILKPIQFAYNVYLYSETIDEDKAIELIANFKKSV